jgi:hypothetical protein
VAEANHLEKMFGLLEHVERMEIVERSSPIVRKFELMFACAPRS